MATSRSLDQQGSVDQQSSVDRHSIIGAILAGGASSRFDGGNKAEVIGPHVLAAMRGAFIDPIIAVGGDPGVLPIPTVDDRYPGEGPLGAVATAATFAKTGWIVTVTCDLPLIRASTFIDLIAAIDADTPDTGVVASVDGKPHVSLGCWPAAWARSLHRDIRAGERRFRHLLTLGPIIQVEVAPEQLRDADDQATLTDLWSGRADMADPGPSGA